MPKCPHRRSPFPTKENMHRYEYRGQQGYQGLMPWLALVARRQRARRVHGYREKSRAARGRRSIIGAPPPCCRCGEQGAGRPQAAFGTAAVLANRSDPVAHYAAVQMNLRANGSARPGGPVLAWPAPLPSCAGPRVRGETLRNGPNAQRGRGHGHGARSRPSGRRRRTQ